METKPKIGFIGLGIMGRHMSAHLIKVGHSLVIFDIDPQALAKIVQHGARPASSCKEVVQRSEMFISMVPDSQDVRQVMLGKVGII